MAQVLGVAAGQLGNPVTVFVLAKADNRRVASRQSGVVQSGPSV